ncbi:hypothetical protein LOTGIDRAFT_125184, partial [Lottia gigantea]
TIYTTTPTHIQLPSTTTSNNDINIRCNQTCHLPTTTSVITVSWKRTLTCHFQQLPLR